MVLDQEKGEYIKSEKYGQKVKAFGFPCNF